MVTENIQTLLLFDFSTGRHLFAVSLVKKSNVKFAHSYKHTLVYDYENSCFITRTKQLHIISTYFTWNTSVTGHEQGTVSFLLSM
jgi:hypothetical protein